MDKTMTRRIIGAIVLVLVAALVLAALLRGKSKQQEIVDVSTPASPILQFPNDTQNDGTLDANQTANQQGTLGQAETGSDAEKVGFEVTQNGTATTGNGSMTNDATQDNQTSQAGGAGSSSMSNAPASNDVISENDKKEATTSGGDSNKPSNTAGLSENDKLDLNGNRDKVSPTETKKEEKAPKAELVNEPRTPRVGEKPKNTPKPKEEEKVATQDDAGVPQGGFSIQLVAITNKARAVAIKKQMIDEGYPAYVSTTMKEGRAFYRVRVGSYPDKAEAEQVQARMKRRYLQNTGVQNSIVVKN
jgi:cell division septation protein DedD